MKPTQTSSATQIDKWHRLRGWRMIGYHYVIRRDGSLERGRAVSEIGAHCSGYNKYSIGIAYEGGLDDLGRPCDTRTQQQKDELLNLLRHLKKLYPYAKIMGHRDFDSTKACPCFEASKEYSNI